MKHKLLAPIIFAGALAAPAVSTATTIGLSSGTFVTTWDVFPYVPGPPGPPNFTAETPDFSTGQVTATAGEAMAGGMMLGNGDRIYAMGNAFDITVSGTANTTIPLIGMVLKFTAPSTGASAAADYFTVLLNGVAADTKGFAGTFTESSEFHVYRWYWTDANLFTDDAFEFTITGAPEHVSLDAIQIIPEPTSAVLGALGVGMLAIRRRRK